MADFKDLMNGFGIVTVMNARIYKPTKPYTAGGATGAVVFKKADFGASVAYLDTLKIANLNIEGPNKTVSGGQYNNPLIKWGKTGTIEMQDALGSRAIFEHFYGADIVETGVAPNKVVTNIGIGGKFAGPFAIEGETFFIDQQTGEEAKVYIFIPQLLPDSVFNITQDAEGDATVFDLNGTVGLTAIQDGDDAARKLFYDIRGASFFA